MSYSDNVLSKKKQKNNQVPIHLFGRFDLFQATLQSILNQFMLTLTKLEWTFVSFLSEYNFHYFIISCHGNVSFRNVSLFYSNHPAAVNRLKTKQNYLHLETKSLQHRKLSFPMRRLNRPPADTRWSQRYKIIFLCMYCRAYMLLFYGARLTLIQDKSMT